MNRDEMDEIKRHFGVVAEDLRNEIRQVAEGVANVDEKIERFRHEVAEEFKEVKSMIKFSYAELDERIRMLENEVTIIKEADGPDRSPAELKHWLGRHGYIFEVVWTDLRGMLYFKTCPSYLYIKDELMLLTAKARYGDNFSRKGE